MCVIKGSCWKFLLTFYGKLQKNNFICSHIQPTQLSNVVHYVCSLFLVCFVLVAGGNKQNGLEIQSPVFIALFGMIIL
jgi:hypothetical protein